MKNNLYMIQIEVTHMPGTQLPEDCAGAFVNVYVAANNIREALDIAESELLSDCYQIVETSSVNQIDLDEDDFDTDEEGYPGNQDLINLQQSGEVWYGPFNCFTPENEDLH